jgi:hypothetical protein
VYPHHQRESGSVPGLPDGCGWVGHWELDGSDGALVVQDHCEPLRSVHAGGAKGGQPQRRRQREIGVREQSEREVDVLCEHGELVGTLGADSVHGVVDRREVGVPIAVGERLERAARRARDAPPFGG